MAMPAAVQAILVAVVAVAIVCFILAVLRKKLTPKAPLTAASIGVVAAIGAIEVATSPLGFGFGMWGALNWPVLGTFLGFVAVQPRPRETRSVLRGLALAAGCASLYAGWESNALALIVGIGVSGVLLKLSASGRSVSGVDGSAG